MSRAGSKEGAGIHHRCPYDQVGHEFCGPFPRCARAKAGSAIPATDKQQTGFCSFFAPSFSIIHLPVTVGLPSEISVLS